MIRKAHTKRWYASVNGWSRSKAQFLSITLALVVSLAAMGLTASSAYAGFGFTSVGGALTEANGSISRQAGAHPDVNVSFSLKKTTQADGREIPDGSLHEVKVDLPPGLIGNSTIVPTCDFNELSPNGTPTSKCRTASQVGFARITSEPNSLASDINVPVFNMVRPDDLPALFAFNYAGVVVKLEPRVRPGDYGISVYTKALLQAQPPFKVDVTFWGVPADPAHDPERMSTDGTVLGVPSPEPRKPFLSNPAYCPGIPSVVTVSADSWQNIGGFVTESFDEDLHGTPLLFNGCERISFNPSAIIRPDSTSASSVAGLAVELKVAQNEGPDGISSADVRKTVVTLPVGFAVNPAAAAGQQGCSEAQIGIGSNAEPTCPDASRLGSVKIATPLLDEELEGTVYLARQGENPFGSLVALYMAVKGPGFYLKLPGKVELGKATGQVVSTFDNTPQLPFEALSLSLRGGPGSPLATPSACGSYVAKVEMTSWANSTPVVLQSPMNITEGCTDGGFSPKFRAGTVVPTGGSFSPFTLQVTREASEANLSRIQATLPPGLLAKLAGVPLCGDAQAATGNCPVASQVGTTTVGAGAGANPLYVPEPGKAPTAVYLAGPYKGAPYSLVVKVPAQAGPFDLGTVVVRNALRVDPTTTQVTAESDPLPQILEGIPISYRDVRVEVNRPEFTVNPTNCSQFQVTSLLTSAMGQTASPKAPFAAANCERLGFKPTLALQMKGQTKRAGNPALTATLKAPAGQANIADTTVILPKTVFIDQRHVSNPCTRVQFNANACPAKSVLGTATATSPLLDQPLTGPVYFRSNGGERQLPDIVADLNGQIHVVLVGFVDSKKVGKETSLVRTRFASVPDAPVSKFTLKLKGGKRSLIQNSANLCKVRPKAEVKMTGQNGKTNDFQQKIAVQCGKAKKSKSKPKEN